MTFGLGFSRVKSLSHATFCHCILRMTPLCLFAEETALQCNLFSLVYTSRIKRVNDLARLLSPLEYGYLSLYYVTFHMTSDWSLDSLKVERLQVLVTWVSHNTSFERTMAWKKLTSLLVVFAVRLSLFLLISLLSCILQGVPNINSCFLTVSIFNLRRWRIAFRFLMGPSIFNSRTTVRLPNFLRLSAARLIFPAVSE